jgi:hypothetical protein
MAKRLFVHLRGAMAIFGAPEPAIRPYAIYDMDPVRGGVIGDAPRDSLSSRRNPEIR